MIVSRPVALTIVAVLAVGLLIVAARDVPYLLRGYELGAAFEGRPVTFSHITFPMWLQVLHVMVFGVGAVTLVLCVRGSRWAAIAGWVTLMIVAPLALYGVHKYGTIGTPISFWLVLLIASLAGLARRLSSTR